MRYRDAAAFRQALEQRLKDRAHGDGARLARDRKHVVFDRLLARLVAAAPERWMLKGGFALDLRLAGRARATKDVDIDWRASEDELLESLIEACNEDLDDFFTFAIERTGAPEDRLGGSHRFRISVSLAERPFETFLLDVGFQRGDTIATETLTTGDLLAFADIAPVEVRAIPLELQIAEKLHAYTRTYEGGHPSSRAKDLIDLALLAELARLDAGDLRTAIDSTFARRDTHPEPRTLPAPPGEWGLRFASSRTRSASRASLRRCTPRQRPCSSRYSGTRSQPACGIQTSSAGFSASRCGNTGAGGIPLRARPDTASDRWAHKWDLIGP